MEKQPQNEQPTQDKTPYQTPEIIDHGTIESKTQAQGTGNQDFNQAGSFDTF